MVRELPDEILQVHYETGPTARMRGSLDSYLTRDGARCVLQVMPGRAGEPSDDLDEISAGVRALLASPGSGWSMVDASTWVRADDARLTFGERNEEGQFWTLVPAARSDRPDSVENANR